MSQNYHSLRRKANLNTVRKVRIEALLFDDDG